MGAWPGSEIPRLSTLSGRCLSTAFRTMPVHSSAARGTCPQPHVSRKPAGGHGRCPFAMDQGTLDSHLRLQDGVISRRQALEAGLTDVDIERRLRRREWARIHPGVYVEHTGPPTWRQRAWAAVLFYWPAALAGRSALAIQNVRGYEQEPGAPIEVSVDRDRRVVRRLGVVVRQHVRADTLAQMELSPPRQRLEHATLDVASAKRGLDRSVGVMADVVQQGRTTPKRLLEALSQRPRLRHRCILRMVLADVQSGVHSVLEYRYVKDVERGHGLPLAKRQRRTDSGGSVTYRDVDYVDFGVTVELDGRIGHSEVADQWSDLERDVATMTGGGLTVRAGWIHVLDPCRLADAVSKVLVAKGWTGTIRACSPNCGVISAPGAENARQTA
jgi:Transcriptional regulator, AbiEi antitoxin